MSRYQPIHQLLRDKTGAVEVSLATLAELIDGGLPASAYRYSAWWASDVSHVQSKSWVAAGYRAEADLSAH